MNNILNWFRGIFSTPPIPEVVGRNEPCTCGSGKKFKNCCMDKIEQEKLARVSAVASQKPFGGRSSPANRALARMKKRK